MATLEEVSKIMAVMALSYPRYELNKGTIRVYADLLKTIPSDVLEAAAKEVMVSSVFFPSLAEWRSKAIDLMIGTHSIPTAAEAWAEAIDHCHNGHYTDYSHPLIQRAAEIIGVAYWRSMMESEEMATRAQFIKIYESLLKRETENLKMLPESRAVSEKYQIENKMNYLLEGEK